MSRIRNMAVPGVLYLLLALGGCNRDQGIGKVDGLWGPGVQDVEAARQKIRSIAIGADDDDWESVRHVVSGIFFTMTWDQATYVYRTSPADLRSVLVEPLIGLGGSHGKFPQGMTKDAIIALLGKPDGDWGESLVYTGQDSASDSCAPGFLFFLDESNRLTYVGCGP